jgi:hypothetical protein
MNATLKSAMAATIAAGAKPSPLIDANIECLIRGNDWEVKNKFSDGSGAWFIEHKFETSGRSVSGPVPVTVSARTYTRTTDDAMSFTPEGWHICAIYGPGNCSDQWRVVLHNSETHRHIIAESATLPLAVSAMNVEAIWLDREESA